MLSQDVVTIINNISEKIATCNFESLTFEDIKNACFLVMGHIEHLKTCTTFPLQDNSKEKELVAYKRNVIHLVEWQARFIEMKKNIVLGNYIADLDFLSEMIHSIPGVLGEVYKGKIEKINCCVSSMLVYINTLKNKLLAANCFDVALAAHLQCTYEITFLYSKLLEIHHSAKMRYSVVIKGYFEATQETFEYYLREITYFRDLEIINAKCLSYCVMNYLPKNVRH
ncbi:hypothetical protein OQJ18_08510 [Fluoribacter dumoffii]|uniref:Uncharacterized protein n=1 Tax=Fluoribacter dumoffii TaxID=463 RepID=A0A377G7B4_9GAMM|nr:hypothetical protein [Fluoribacter dumoffii]KTC89606.1 hypothetical protein Ldum_0674 [Fluoribacter dumoffii NY 23]MCW8417862.1 hypothetical protein [Fluoribacter dumoffii]MCW8454296.1 hypothetical protein [Fluoribacter dumoffii]MCW8461630.1 hypothetical protein [Fluoribacter dumoffii]MCW8481846.1 hypothetical protein [Fluoribacter dumoffii]